MSSDVISAQFCEYQNKESKQVMVNGGIKYVS